MTTAAAVRAAYTRLEGVVRKTPLLTSPFLDEIAGRQVFIKPECLQHTGSFKFRGAWAAVTALPPDVLARGVLAFSSGNHAQGVALAAARMGVPAVIIMPLDAPRIKIDNTRALGAEVVFYDRVNGEDRDAVGAKLSAERGLHLIKPYDDPDVIAGQGSVGLELAAQLVDTPVTKADVLVCCGGGGLTSGISLALSEAAPMLRVRPCEPEGFDDVMRSLASGKREENPRTSGTLCDAIVTQSPGELTFPILSANCGPGLAVSDDECLVAMSHAFSRLKLVLEPGGAASLAAALFRADQIEGDHVIVVATGGNVDVDVFARAIAKGTT